MLKKAIGVAIAAMLTVGGTFAVANQTSDVQEKLGVTADGVMGPQTKRAIKRYQRAHGLTVDGVIGPETLAALGLSRARTASNAGLETIAQCESGGDPTAISGDGTYRGKYQFDRGTWRAIGGEGDPAKASEAEQDRRARKLYRQQGLKPWPACGAALSA